MPEFYKKQRFLYPVYVLAFFVFVLITILGYFHWIMGMTAFLFFVLFSFSLLDSSLRFKGVLKSIQRI